MDHTSEDVNNSVDSNHSDTHTRDPTEDDMIKARLDEDDLGPDIEDWREQ